MKTHHFTLRSLAKSLAIVPVLAAGAFFSHHGVAGTATDNLSVSASVAANCTIGSTALSFGSYDPISSHNATALDGTGTVTVTCTNGSSATITLGQGSNGDVGSTDADPARRLNDGATNYLAYDLFSDSGRTTEWGNTAGTGVGTTGTGSSDEHTVYGRIAAGQTSAQAGSYTDTVVATVTF